MKLRIGPPKIARHDRKQRQLRLCQIPAPNGAVKRLGAATPKQGVGDETSFSHLRGGRGIADCRVHRHSENTPRDSPASMSTHEEATRSTATPMMGVFNNLVLFDQHVPQTTLSSIVPDLAVAWTWDEDKTALTFHLRQDVRWHDGKPFSPKDVKCTWDLLTGKSSEKLRVNPRRSWYRNLEEVTIDSDSEVTFHLKRPQPFFLALLASAVSPVYPCHVSPAEMRQHPIGTGPFKFVEYKPNESIRLSRNTDY